MGIGQICLDCLNGSELLQAKRFRAGTTPGWQKLSQYEEHSNMLDEICAIMKYLF